MATLTHDYELRRRRNGSQADLVTMVSLTLNDDGTVTEGVQLEGTINQTSGALSITAPDGYYRVSHNQCVQAVVPAPWNADVYVIVSGSADLLELTAYRTVEALRLAVERASADARYAPSTGSAEYATKAEAASSGFSAIPAHNVTLDTRAHWREAVGRVIAGSGNAKVLIVGDSTDWGLGSGGADGYPPSKSLARLLNNSYLPTQYGFGVPAGSSAPTADGDRDDRWSKNAVDGWAFTTWGLGSLGAYQHGGTSTSTAKTFEPGIACDTFVVYYLTNSGLGTLDLSIDGGAVTSQSTAGALGVGSVTITAASVTDAHVLSIVKRVNTVFVFGVYAYDSTTPSIHMLNAGVCNSRAYQASGASWASDAYKSLSMIGALAPDLTIIRLGINDSRLASSSSAANWETAIRTIIAKAQESGDVILCSTVPSQSTVMSSDGTTPAVTLQGQYRDRCLTIVEDLDCAYVDIFGRYGSWSDADALGFMYDSLHLTAEGSADAADAIRRVMIG